MTRHCIALAVLSLLTTFGYAQPSLPSSFQAKTVHSPEVVREVKRYVLRSRFAARMLLGSKVPRSPHRNPVPLRPG